VALGPLVARVGLVPDAVLVHGLVSLHRMVGDRLIAGLGTGDSLNREENEAYGIPFRPVAERPPTHVVTPADRSCRQQVTTDARRSVAVRRAAAEADGWNGWGTDVDTFAADTTGVPPGRALTWGGQVLIGRTRAEADAKLRAHGGRPGLVAGTPDDLVGHLRGLAGAGATWAICAPLDVGTDAAAVELLAEAAAGCR